MVMSSWREGSPASFKTFLLDARQRRIDKVNRLPKIEKILKKNSLLYWRCKNKQKKEDLGRAVSKLQNKKNNLLHSQGMYWNKDVPMYVERDLKKITRSKDTLKLETKVSPRSEQWCVEIEDWETGNEFFAKFQLPKVMRHNLWIETPCVSAGRINITEFLAQGQVLMAYRFWQQVQNDLEDREEEY